MASTALEKILGTTLVTGKGEIQTANLAVDVIGIYFSAHWCPPCRGFTPELAKFYKQHAKAKNFEIVFASSDKDEAAFQSYFKEMPWKALPYADRALKEKLSKKYKVSGIPTLVFVDAKTGKVITTEGRAGVDSGIAKFPYPKPTWDGWVALDETVVTASGDETTFSKATEGKKHVAFYFSAHWCPPCRAFTPELSKWRKDKLPEDAELFFVSADKDQKTFNDYHKTMSFDAMSFKGSSKDTLSSLFGVEGYPTLVVVERATGKVVTEDGRSKVSSEPDLFPWPEKAVEPLGGAMGSINDVPLAMLLVDKAVDQAAVDAATAAFTEVAEETFAAGAQESNDGDVCAEEGDDDEEAPVRVRFALAKEGDETVDRVRDFFGLADDTKGSFRLFASDIPSGCKFVWEGKAAPSSDDIRTFVGQVASKASSVKVGLREAVKAA